MTFTEYLQHVIGVTGRTLANYLHAYNNRENYAERTVNTIVNYETLHKKFVEKVNKKTKDCEFTYLEYLQDCTLLSKTSIQMYNSCLNPNNYQSAGHKKHYRGYLKCLQEIQNKPQLPPSNYNNIPSPNHYDDSNWEEPNPPILSDVEDILTSNLRDGLKLHMIKLIIRNQ